jgi:hypothetical protein
VYWETRVYLSMFFKLQLNDLKLIWRHDGIWGIQYK